jgi:hypothetical protein
MELCFSGRVPRDVQQSVQPTRPRGTLSGIGSRGTQGAALAGRIRPSGFAAAAEEMAMNRLRALIASIAVLVAAPIASPAAELAHPAQPPVSVSAARTDRPHCVTGRLPLDRRHRTCAGRSSRWW